MSTSPVASELEILDLRHFSARQLRPLLEEEARLWNQRLRWDYRSSTELLLEYLDSRVLQGFAALVQGRVCGYSFCVYEGNKAVIGDAFASGQGAAGDHDTVRTLLVHMLEMLRHSPLIDRVESQLLLSNAGDFDSIFVPPAFRTFPRLFLECDLTGREAAAWPEPGVSSVGIGGMALSPWAPQDYQAAGELIHAAYAGHTDAQINDQYRSLHGALRFLHNIVRFPGCGIFDPTHSWVLRDRNARGMTGLVLVSRVGLHVAHITQFCIAPSNRGQGLGQMMLRHSLATLRAAGFEAITLTVTESNAAALRLYEAFGFRRRHRFDAMVLEMKRAF